MANEEHVALLKQGVEAWNTWRLENPDIHPDLSGVDLSGANLDEADLRGADLTGVDLEKQFIFKANFYQAKLGGANLSGAYLGGAYLLGADLTAAKLVGADLSSVSAADLTAAKLIEADLSEAKLGGVNLHGAILTGAFLTGADLSRASLVEADLSWAFLAGANLTGADLSGANLSRAFLAGADLSRASLVEADLTDADLIGCRIYGTSVWSLKLSEGTKQQNLVITRSGEPEITADDIKVAQFIYLLLHNKKIRRVIDTITSKAVLILGRFTDERKEVLDALRDELRKRNYLPILFDFDKPDSKDLTGTVQTLANLVRFIIADVTDPSSIPHELATIIPATPIPVRPILLSGKSEFAMFNDLRWRHDWVLATHHYDTPEQLLADLSEQVINPAERKVLELEARRPR